MSSQDINIASSPTAGAVTVASESPLVVDVTTNLTNATACVTSASAGLFVVSPQTVSAPNAKSRQAYCVRAAPTFQGAAHARQLEASNLFAMVGDGQKMSSRKLRIFRCSFGGDEKTNNVAEMIFRESILDVQWTRHNLVVVLSRSVNIFSSRTLVHRHRIRTRRQRPRHPGLKPSVVVAICPFILPTPTSSDHSQLPSQAVEFNTTLSEAGIEDLIVLNDAKESPGTLTILGLANDQLHLVNVVSPHSAEVALLAINPKRRLLASVSMHGQLVRITELATGLPHMTCKLAGEPFVCFMRCSHCC